MGCADVRDRLAEHALHVLPAGHRAGVERHLEWCAGCRREARQLADGAAAVALSLPAPEPPERLERRVLAVASRPPRRRGPLVAALAAALVAAVSLGLAGAMAGRMERLQDAAAEARAEADRSVRAFEGVLQEVAGGQAARSAALVPVRAARGGGRAVVYDATGGDDFALVAVGGLPDRQGPYRAFLASTNGRVAVGHLTPAGPGQAARYRFFAQDVGEAREVVVLDGAGRTVLRGRLQAPAR
jgi:hypothetical protein